MRSSDVIPMRKFDFPNSLSFKSNLNKDGFISLLSSQTSDISIYNPFNGRKIEISKLCKNIDFNIYHPPLNNLLNFTLYNEFRLKNIDIYNNKDKFFNDLCVPYSNDKLKADLPLNYRRLEVSNNKTVNCGNGCIYEGINSNNYIICKCTQTHISKTEILNAFSVVIKSNLEIIKCVHESFNDKMLLRNPGLLIFFIFIFFFNSINLYIFNCI